MENVNQTKLDTQGIIWGLASYAMWGFFPIYWKLLADRSAPEVLAHRMVWSFVFYLLIFIGTSYREFPSFLNLSRKDWLLSGIASALLALNWGIYIYAVNSGHILEGSLAYFINPILNVAVGVLFFKESFPLILRLSVLFAVMGVGAKVLYSPTFPWISLVLAFTFCAYGVTKKMLRIPARTSSVLEGAIGVIPALIAVTYFQKTNLVPLTNMHWFLLALGGAVTGLPLFLFSFAAQRIPYSIMGMLQFLAPSLQFIVGVFMFNEAFGFQDMVTFGLIWVGISFYLAYQAIALSRVRN